jgi:hypothetical protein
MMMNGVAVPKITRDEVAVRAYEMYCSREWPSRRQALIAIEAELDVSTPTARNLINRGRSIVRATA